MKSNIHQIIFQTHQKQIYIYKAKQQQLNLQQYLGPKSTKLTRIGSALRLEEEEEEWQQKQHNDRENHRTTPLSTVVSDCVKRWFQKAKGDDFSGEFVGGIVDVIDVGYGDMTWADSVNSIDRAVQESD